MKILIVGLTSTAIGGMEFHNLGNYIIMEPLIEELQNTFPGAEIRTSIQMSDDYCRKWNIVSLRDKRFFRYKFTTGLRTIADIFKVSLWKVFSCVGLKLDGLLQSSLLLREIKDADLVIDFSGDVYGDNAHYRAFLEANARLWFAMVMKKKIAMIIGSPGPFKSAWRKIIAKYILRNVDLLTNREAVSTELLADMGITGEHIYSTACPSVLFRKEPDENMVQILETEGLNQVRQRPLVGLILCGWNMPVGPYNRWPREDVEYSSFVELVRYLIEEKNVDVCLMSHQNGTDDEMRLQPANDHKLIARLMEIIGNKYPEDRLFTLKGLYTAAQSKAIISHFDILVSGRIHGAVQGLSQGIPSVIIDYGHEPKAHKLKGFARIYDVEDFVVDPTNADQLKETVSKVLENRGEIAEGLEKRIPLVKELTMKNFTLLHELAYGKA
ncbi:polysaccharide pyruvyl transferase family protein [Emcibacter nanhaiensis]|uniref:Polysaccharide pyruvyl transferase family protein n=1 Tax=Emcibacter nanhaiensis TaxID=1505037 RepID=A0A501PB51_9PROT|nr:polysaccharide pyruvyl transferase family protein [Emcibacter nanhaiensis]TPD57418.1 polysaccharide pyruvyl transferase family protein [Emcibacter nanhaiensis]